ncbi:hypothetical protein M5E87_14265 [Flavonifractor plautii]|nr:hypothetical protein M5E87_14265 [Flavonifractor plautii]
MGYSVYYYYVNSYWLLGDAGGGSSSCWRWMGCSPRMRPSPTEATPGGVQLPGAPGRSRRTPRPAAGGVHGERGGPDLRGQRGLRPLSSGPQADFQREQPNRSVDAVFPAGPGYVVLSWDEAHTTLRASGLERSRTDGCWHELTANECPAPEPGKLSAARLGPGAAP